MEKREMWPWETGAADWARKRRSAAALTLRPTIEFERETLKRNNNTMNRKGGRSNGTNGPGTSTGGRGGSNIDKSGNDNNNPKTVVSVQKKRRAQGKFDKLVETRKELQVFKYIPFY